MVRGQMLLKQRQVDAFITAGSTGAAMSGALFNVGRIKGIHRPALAPLLPTLKGHAILIDCGANADCKADYLVQFAAMGAAYMESVENVKRPRGGADQYRRRGRKWVTSFTVRCIRSSRLLL